MLLEDYGLIGDLQSAALVGRNGAVDWLCLPRFDSASCFSALLGDERHGRWLVAPDGEVRATSRRYRPGTLMLETDFETPDGAVRVIDFMPRRREGPPRLMRIVEGLRGRGSDADGPGTDMVAMIVLAGFGLVGLVVARLLPAQPVPSERPAGVAAPA
jgi:hypothetical protein